MKVVNFAIILILAFSSCKKGDSISDPNNNNILSDSITIITRINESNTNATTYFSYDTINKRYSNWYKHYTPYNYDSVFIFYNSAGKISSLVHKYPIGGSPYAEDQVAVFQYSGTGTLSKIYLKKIEDCFPNTTTYNTNISDPSTLQSYDSLNYTSSGQLASVYTRTVYSGQLFSYKKLYYHASNDSLLAKVENYQRDGSGNYPLSDVINFTTYDDKVNPLYHSFKDYGVYSYFPARFNPLPVYFVSSYSNVFATYSPHNCTTSGNIISYIYNSDGYPVQCYIGVAPTAQTVNFFYKKIKR